MPGAIANLLVRLTMDTADYERGNERVRDQNDKTRRSTRSMGDDMSRAGRDMTAKLTLPIVAVGAAAVKTAVDFDTSFSRMQGLAGVSASEVAGLKDQVMALSGETAQSPQELAEALYFVRSAGIEGEAAMETLEVSARGAAAGLGEAQVVADVVTAALNAYASEGLTAAQAGDQLTAAVKSAKVEASELAPQLGAILPIASQLGVGFDEVAAATAYFTMKSGDASRAGTYTRSILQKLVKPSQQAEVELRKLGTSSEELRRKVAEDGLLPTLVDLASRVDGELAPAFGRIFEDSEAVAGALDLVSGGGRAAAEVFDDTANSAGALDNAFASFAESKGFGMQQAWAELGGAMITLGDAIIPTVSKIAGVVADAASAFSSLPDGVQDIIVVIGTLVAVAGPAVWIVGNLMKAFSLGKTILTSIPSMFDRVAAKAYDAAGGVDKMTGAVGGIGSALGIAGLAVGAGIALWSMWNQQKQEAKRKTDEFIASLDQETMALGENAEAHILSTLESNNQLDDLADLGVAYQDWANAVGDADNEIAISQNEARNSMYLNDEARQRLIDTLHEEGGSRNELLAKILEEDHTNQGLIDTLFEQTGAYDVAQERRKDRVATGADEVVANEEAAGATEELAEETRTLAEEYEEANQQLEEAKTRLQEYFDAITSGLDASIAWEEAIDGLTAAWQENAGSLDVGTEAGRNNWQALQAVADAAIGAGQQVLDAGGSMDDARGRTELLAATLRDQLIRDLGLSEQRADEVIRQLGLMPDQITTAYELSGIDEALAKIQMIKSAGVGGRTTAAGGLNLEGFASGGLVTSPMFGLVGEAGPELILPLSRPARMMDLLEQAGLLRPFADGGFARMGSTVPTAARSRSTSSSGGEMSNWDRLMAGQRAMAALSARGMSVLDLDGRQRVQLFGDGNWGSNRDRGDQIADYVAGLTVEMDGQVVGKIVSRNQQRTRKGRS